MAASKIMIRRELRTDIGLVRTQPDPDIPISLLQHMSGLNWNVLSPAELECPQVHSTPFTLEGLNPGASGAFAVLSIASFSSFLPIAR